MMRLLRHPKEGRGLAEKILGSWSHRLVGAALVVWLGTSAACTGGGGATPRDAGDAAAVPDGASDGADDSATVVAACGPIGTPNAWATWIMPNPVRSGLPSPASYTVNASGNQVTDNVTGLVWQRKVDSRLYTWDDARRACTCLSVDDVGSGNWRLPSRIELASITDWTISNPAVDSVAFPSTPNADFWSSSPFVGDPTFRTLVFFQFGYTSFADLGDTHHIRCVRSPASAAAPLPPGRYLIAAGTVRDTQTKLTWQQTIDPAVLYTWDDAKATCAQLTLDGPGWRVPSINELQTLVDEGVTASPSIDASTFPKTPTEYFWSSSIDVEDPSQAWTVFFANGTTYRIPLNKPKNVRCVRP